MDLKAQIECPNCKKEISIIMKTGGSISPKACRHCKAEIVLSEKSMKSLKNIDASLKKLSG